MFSRNLKAPKTSFFLFGARATGKSTWLRAHFSNAMKIDLLKNDTYLPLLRRPGLIREMILGHKAKPNWIVVDEVQRIPLLLNEIHSLMEEHGLKFALSG